MTDGVLVWSSVQSKVQIAYGPADDSAIPKPHHLLPHLNLASFKSRMVFYRSGTGFSALTLLVGSQEGHPACKKLSGEVLVWLSIWSKVQTCIWPS